MSIAARRVVIVGSGNFASAVALNIGRNVLEKPHLFQPKINMWVFEEIVQNRNLSDIINESKENVKYLPGARLPSNIVAIPNLVTACKNADLLIFCLPHQFLDNVCQNLKNCIKKDALALSLIKGIQINDGKFQLLSKVIESQLKIPTSVLMGANLAGEIAENKFCESTLGAANPESIIFKDLLQTENFRIQIVNGDIASVEICGALKNVVALAAGFADGQNMGDNAKAAIIRIGLLETMALIKTFYSESKLQTFFESCGIADLITTCYGGRNRRIARLYAENFPNKSMAQIEKEVLNGQKLQGPLTALEISGVIKRLNLENKYPMFITINEICQGQIPPNDLLNRIKKHSYEMKDYVSTS